MAASDSFHYFLNLIEKDYQHTVVSYTQFFAVIGVVYVTYKCLKFLKCVLISSYSSISSILRPKNFVKEYGHWAVVTGCTEGMGLAFADELASRGMNVLLLSRNIDKLIATKNILVEKYHVSVEYFVIDFNEFDNYFDDLIPIFMSKDIGILVNNVGVMFKYPEIFSKVPIERISEIINVNISSTTKLTHLALSKFLLNGKGAIITLSSASSIHPTSLFSVYSASKEYLKYLMRSIEYEHRGSGVTFLTLYPSYVVTRMTKYSETLAQPSLFVPTANTYVKSALKCVGRTRESSAYFPHILQNFLGSFFPESIWMWASYHLHNRFKNEYKKKN